MSKPSLETFNRSIILAFLFVLAFSLALGACISGKQTAPPAAASQATVPSETGTAEPTASPRPTLAPATPTPRPSRTATPKPTPTRAVSPTPTWPFPTPNKYSLEAFGMSYVADATPRYPPSGGVHRPIWDQELPVRPLLTEPQFVIHPAPNFTVDPEYYLVEAGCTFRDPPFAECPPDSPLSTFRCDMVIEPGYYSFPSTTSLSLVAGCWKPTTNFTEPAEDALYRVGCAFPADVSYLFKYQEELVLIDTRDGLKELLLPLESPAEALSYARLLTGLDPHFSFTYDEWLMYFQETIETSQVIETGSGFTVTLFHSQSCHCEPWVTTEIRFEVTRDGEINVKSMTPIYMTTGFGCAD